MVSDSASSVRSSIDCAGGAGGSARGSIVGGLHGPTSGAGTEAPTAATDDTHAIRLTNQRRDTVASWGAWPPCAAFAPRAFPGPLTRPSRR